MAHRGGGSGARLEPRCGGECAAFHSLGWLRSRSLADSAHASYQYTRPYTQTPPPGVSPNAKRQPRGGPHVCFLLWNWCAVRQKEALQPPEAVCGGDWAFPGCRQRWPGGRRHLNRGGWREAGEEATGDRPRSGESWPTGDREGGPAERVRPPAPTGTVCQNETEETATHRQRPMEAILDAIGGLSAGRAGVATAGVFGAMERVRSRGSTLAAKYRVQGLSRG